MHGFCHPPEHGTAEGTGNLPGQFRPKVARRHPIRFAAVRSKSGYGISQTRAKEAAESNTAFFTRASRIQAMHGRVRPPQRTSEKFARLPQNRCEVLPESVRGVIFPETHRKKAGGRCTFGIIREKPGTPLQILPGLRTATAKRTHAGTGGNAATM